MAATVVVFDPDGILPLFDEGQAGAGVSIIRAARTPDAQRYGRDAAVVVLVAGHDNALSMGFLAAIGRLHDARLVLVVTDARRQRRVLIHAMRRGAVVLVEQPPSALVGCLRELLASRPPSLYRRLLLGSSDAKRVRAEVSPAAAQQR